MKRKSVLILILSAVGAFVYFILRTSAFSSTTEPLMTITAEAHASRFLDSNYRFVNTTTFRFNRVNKLKFAATFNELGNRITSYEPTLHKQQQKVVLLGCSFVEGYYVDDSVTAAFLLQRSMPNVEVINAGRAGCGTWEAVKQLKRHNEVFPGRLSAVVYCYASFHDERNLENDLWKLRMAEGSFHLMVYQKHRLVMDSSGCIQSIPFVRYDGDQPVGYSASVITASQATKAFRYWLANRAWQKQQQEAHQLSERLLKYMQVFCRKRNIPFYVSMMTSDEITDSMIGYCSREGISVIPSRINWQSPIFTLLPLTGHPNSNGHRVLAAEWQKVLLLQK